MRFIGVLVGLCMMNSAAHGGREFFTTIITHGFSPDSKGPWVQSMAEAIIARAGGGSIYRYTGPAGYLSLLPSQFSDGTNDVVVLIFNWVPESDGPSTGPNLFYAQGAGDALYSILRDAQYDPANPTPGPSDLVTNRIVHFIGHSRGACVNSETARRLAIDKLTVDQITTHDPHPVNGTLDSPYNFDWGDPTPQKWSNVSWADNYWRADGGGFINGLDFDGIVLPASFNTQLSESALNCCAYSFAHSDVHLWYHGTIDLAPNPNDGEQDITDQMRQTWWPQGYAERGFFYSVLGGGSGLRPGPLPAGADPGSLPRVFNGTFEQGSYSGWLHHGGAATGATITLESGDHYMRIGPSQMASATHNRFFLPVGAQSINFESRVYTGAAGEQLTVDLLDALGSAHPIGVIPLSVAGSWMPQSLPIPPEIQSGQTYRLRFAKGNTNAVVGIDDIDIILQAALVGDITANGCVDVDDLLAVINAWGPCAACAADITSNGQVDVDDLLVVINNWQPCP
jgi:hypothetical protein